MQPFETLRSLLPVDDVREGEESTPSLLREMLDEFARADADAHELAARLVRRTL
jgi:hypothetical protein